MRQNNALEVYSQIYLQKLQQTLWILFVRVFLRKLLEDELQMERVIVDLTNK
jgi:hypothetical protein